jgi:DNA-directed RNA polymerase subunit RPC12/RpoP
MARPPYRVDNDRPALIHCNNCGRNFGERVRQKGYETEEGGISWYMDDTSVRCPHCDSPDVQKVGTS